MLTDEERERIVEAIYRGRVGSCRVTVENWGPAEDEEETHSLLLRVLRGESDRFVADAQTTIESIITARVRAARAQELRDAATAWNQGQWARHYAIPKQAEPAVERWLRDRANHIESSEKITDDSRFQSACEGIHCGNGRVCPAGEGATEEACQLAWAEINESQ